MTRAMLLCAGYGTRLRPLTDACPKPMLPVCNVPILRYGITNLVRHGIIDIVINLHYLGDVIHRDIGDGADLGARVHYIDEPDILGTGGGLKHALALLDPDGRDEPFVSMNGKLIFDVDVAGLLAAFRAAPADTLGMMAVRPVPDAMAWGAVDVDASGVVPQVRDILGAGHYMFAGVHVTRPSVMARLPDGEACSIRQGYLPWIRADASVAAFIVKDGYFAEHSTAKRYFNSNMAVLQMLHDGDKSYGFIPAMSKDIASEAEISPQAVIIPPVCIGAGVRVAAGAQVGPNAVIGDRAVVGPGARVERAVVWAECRIDRNVRDAVVTPTAHVDVS